MATSGDDTDSDDELEQIVHDLRRGMLALPVVFVLSGGLVAVMLSARQVANPAMKSLVRNADNFDDGQVILGLVAIPVTLWLVRSFDAPEGDPSMTTTQVRARFVVLTNLVQWVSGVSLVILLLALAVAAFHADWANTLICFAAVGLLATLINVTSPLADERVLTERQRKRRLDRVRGWAVTAGYLTPSDTGTSLVASPLRPFWILGAGGLLWAVFGVGVTGLDSGNTLGIPTWVVAAPLGGFLGAYLTLVCCQTLVDSEIATSRNWFFKACFVALRVALAVAACATIVLSVGAIFATEEWSWAVGLEALALVAFSIWLGGCALIACVSSWRKQVLRQQFNRALGNKLRSLTRHQAETDQRDWYLGKAGLWLPSDQGTSKRD